MNQKLEDILQLALQTPEQTRALTEELNVGFDTQARTWELIVKYHGSLETLKALGIEVEYLIAGYAVLTVPEQFVDRMVELEEIEYVEMPKRYFYDIEMPTDNSCIAQVTLRHPNLSGAGVLVAVLDSGIDYKLPEFRKSDGSTRIRFLWDQTLQPEAPAGAGTGREAGGSAATDMGGAENAAMDGTQDSAPNAARPARRPPAGYRLGVEFDSAQINQALAAPAGQRQYELLPSIDSSGHGTAVAGIAAGCLPAYGSVGSRPGISGNGLAENPGIPGSQYRGAAPAASLLAVKLGLPGEEGFPRTTEIMRGVTYALQKAMELEMPLVINLSFGNTYGSHDGGSLLERFLDNAAEIGRSVICVGSGNEGNSAGHVAGNLFGEGNRAASGSTAGAFRGGGTSGAFGGSGAFGAMASPGMTGPGGTARPAEIQLAVAEYERSLSIQLWKNYSDVYRIYLRSPGGQEAPLPEPVEDGKYTLQLEQTQILVYLGKPLPYAAAQEIYLELIVPAATAAPGPGMADAAAGGRQYINSGVWTIRIEPVQTVTGQYYLYLPSYAARSSRTGFYQPTPQVTLTIPSTAAKVITVGAYDSTYDSYADFSGRGYVDAERTIGVISAGLVKPDLAAPGVGILAPDLYGGYSPFTGTSFATPIVSGAAALLMEWGEGVIIRSR